jgi:hypothetical protein
LFSGFSPLAFGAPALNIFSLVGLVFEKLYKQRFLGIGKKIENDENPGERHGFVTLKLCLTFKA